MHIGAAIRRMFGPYERQISEAYRSLYIDIDAFVNLIRQWKPEAAKILEVGCGEGAVTQRLHAAFPGAQITAIDITPRLGRLFQGATDRVRFVQCTVQEMTVSDAGRYDLIVLSDVLHHVPEELRMSLLDGIRTSLAPGASFIFKDWRRSVTPIHYLSYISDRWLTGDRIHYMTRDEMRDRLQACFGADALRAEATVRPWSNNIAFLVRE